MPRYRRYLAPGQTVFLTLACRGRLSWLEGETAKVRALSALHALKQVHPFAHLAHVLLDDHLHVMLRPAPRVQVPALVGSFKRAAMVGSGGRRGGRMWQRRYHDHIVRDAEDFQRHLDYIHFNPVKHGCAPRASAWSWSSLAAWTARGVYAPDCGEVMSTSIWGFAEGWDR